MAAMWLVCCIPNPVPFSLAFWFGSSVRNPQAAPNLVKPMDAYFLPKGSEYVIESVSDISVENITTEALMSTRYLRDTMSRSLCWSKYDDSVFITMRKLTHSAMHLILMSIPRSLVKRSVFCVLSHCLYAHPISFPRGLNRDLKMRSLKQLPYASGLPFKISTDFTELHRHKTCE